MSLQFHSSCEGIAVAARSEYSQGGTEPRALLGRGKKHGNNVFYLHLWERGCWGFVRRTESHVLGIVTGNSSLRRSNIGHCQCFNAEGLGMEDGGWRMKGHLGWVVQCINAEGLLYKVRCWFFTMVQPYASWLLCGVSVG